jgi:putative hydrolase of the HAD superfamily
MQNIKNIIFDLGGVILNLDIKRTENAFVSMGVTRLGDLFGLGHAASSFKDYETGKIDDRQFVQSIRELSGLSVSDETIIDGWNAMLMDFPPERIALLDELAKRYRIFLFSNTNALHLAALQRIYGDTFGNRKLDDHFEKAYYSHLLGMRKPATESYLRILRENGLKGSETLFIDDALINVEGANSAGLQGFHLKPGMTMMDIIFP